VVETVNLIWKCIPNKQIDGDGNG